MQNCAHPACTCRHDRDDMVEKGGSLYCNDRCSRQDPGKGSCGGHDGCAG